MNAQEISFLIASHLIVADGEIDKREVEVLKKYATPDILEEQSKIFADDDTKISLDELIQKAKLFSQGEKQELLKILFGVIYADTYYHSNEKKFIDELVEKIEFSPTELNAIQKGAEQERKFYVEKEQSFLENALETFASWGYKLTGSEFFEERLLEGKEFVNNVKNISKKAYADLEFTTQYMEEINHKLEANYDQLKKETRYIEQYKRNDESSEELINFSKLLNDKLNRIISENLKENREILDKKKSTINYFTIAFMGRTKAGKSTFHKVVTGEELDDIGVGKLRTTRYNRAFTWKNLRIVDTPGIGAPGGKTDTETAKSIIDEADLVCYLVTNDAIQTTEFDFLKGLKEKNKPLFIILNIKENIDNATRLKRFLQKPLKWREDKGNRDITGHFERIKECIKGNYDINSVEIIPIQLLAALLSDDKEKDFSDKERKLLLEGSNMAEYNHKIKQTIFRTGHLKKTQNIIEGCNYQVQTVLKEIEASLIEINRISQSLIKNKESLNRFISDERKVTINSIKQVITNVHNELRGSIDRFAAQNYDVPEKELEARWKIHSESYYKKLQAEIEVIYNKFEKDLKGKIEEVTEDFQMELSFFAKNSNIGIQSYDTTNYKSYVAIGGTVLGALGGTLAFFGMISNPIGWAIGIGSVLVGLASFLFDSKEKRIQKAVNKIKESLTPAIEKSKQSYEAQVIPNIEGFIREVSEKLNNKFNQLISCTNTIINILESIKKESISVENIFNNILFYRILEHLKLEKKELTKEQLSLFLDKNTIERDFKTSVMTIKSSYDISDEQEKEISRLLQTNIKFSKI